MERFRTHTDGEKKNLHHYFFFFVTSSSCVCKKSSSNRFCVNYQSDNGLCSVILSFHDNDINALGVQ